MSYKINIDSLRQEGLKAVFEAFENCFNKLGIDFYLIGAIARDAWFVNNDIEPIGTKDIDLAVYIPSKADYKNLIDHLVKHEHFNTSTQNEFVVFSPEGIQVDLLPFGEIEVEGKVMIDGVGLSKIAVNGFREVYKNGLVEIEFDNSQTFKVCSLPSIVILKLIAYDDRPEIRQKDIQDISLILDHYFNIETELIYDQHNDLFEDDRDLSIIAARVIGRQIKIILNESKELEDRIIHILETEIADFKKSKIAEFMIQGTDKSIKDAIELLNELLKGLKD